MKEEAYKHLRCGFIRPLFHSKWKRFSSNPQLTTTELAVIANAFGLQLDWLLAAILFVKDCLIPRLQPPYGRASVGNFILPVGNFILHEQPAVHQE